MPRHPPCALSSLIVFSLDSCFTKRIFSMLHFFQSAFYPFLLSLYFVIRFSRCSSSKRPPAFSLRIRTFGSLRVPGRLKCCIRNIPSPIRRTRRRIELTLGGLRPHTPWRRSAFQKVRLRRLLRSPARANCPRSPRKAQLCGAKEERRSARAFTLAWKQAIRSPLRRGGGLKWTRTTDLTLIRRAL